MAIISLTSYDNHINSFFQISECMCLTQIQGKNMFIIAKHLNVMVVCLNNVANFMIKNEYGNFCTVTNCRNIVFQHLLSKEIINHLSSWVCIFTSSFILSYNKSSIKNIKHCYDDFASSNKWIVHCKVTACFS